MTEIDRLWREACTGDKRAFGDWAGRVERPVLRSLQRFALAVDVESVMQETLLRMWRRAQDDGIQFEGEHASLRSALITASNLARNMARKHKREHLLPPEQMPEGGDSPARPPEDPPSDPFLRRIIEQCLAALRGPLRRALRMRLEHGHRPDAELAALLRMTRNTFLQNIARARKQLDQCLSKNGAHEHEALS